MYHNITEPLKDFAFEVARRVARNPVLVGTSVLWGAEALNTGSPITARGFITVAIGVLVRSKVVPANEVLDFGEFLQATVHDISDVIGEGVELADEEHPDDEE